MITFTFAVGDKVKQPINATRTLRVITHRPGRLRRIILHNRLAN